MISVFLKNLATTKEKIFKGLYQITEEGLCGEYAEARKRPLGAQLKESVAITNN